MKKFNIIILIVLFPAAILAQQASVQNTSVKLSSSADTLQYTLGAFIGQWFAGNGFNISNHELFKAGLDDAMQNKLALPDTIIAPIVANYQLVVQNARSKQLEEQLFAALKGQPGVGVLPNGVHYVIIKATQGIRPSVADTVTLNAIGVFADGTVFEDTFAKQQPIVTAITRLIPGLSEIVQLMPIGSVWRVFVPSALGYGPQGLPNLIPPNTALVYDITLMDIKNKQ